MAHHGNDQAPGTSPATAWQSVERASQATLNPGDRVLFEAGRSFDGNLILNATQAGTAQAPVVVTSFGPGRATLRAGNATGITVRDAGGITLENLEIVGNGRTHNRGFGVLCENTRPGPQLLQHLRLAHLDVHGFGLHGIMVTGTESGFRHVRIHGCVLRDNLRGGMEIAGKLPWDSPRYAHADVQVSHCQAFDNTGDPEYLKNHSGSGLVLYQVDGGTIEHCQAWNNGALCRNRGGGPVGIWTCASRRVTIQHCESFRNRTSGADGGGFDLDGGCVECVLQYNYSHDNDGPGLMVYTYPYASHADQDNLVRFNVSENDSRRSRTYAGLWVRSDGRGMTNLTVHNNTVVTGAWTDQAAGIHGEGVHATFRNNLFLSSGNTVPLRVEKPHAGLRFENNLYWRRGGRTEIVWGERTYQSLARWRKDTRQETLHGRATGYFRDPQMALPAGHTLTSNSPPPSQLPLFYRPPRSSIAARSGLPQPSHPAADEPPADLLGRPLVPGRSWPMGALLP